MPNEPVAVEEYFRGRLVRSVLFDTFDEAQDFVSRQADEPGVEWVYLGDVHG